MRTALSIAAACLLAAVPAAAQGPAYHLFRTPGTARMQNAAASKMLYYGGPVLSAAAVKVVFWGNTVAATTTAKAGPFLSAIVRSTYVDQLAQYSTKGLTGVGGHAGSNQTIGRGTYLGVATIKPANASKSLTDAAIQKELIHQITIGKLPRHTPNTLYMVYFPADITITLGGSVSCQAFGAYHEAAPGKAGAANLFYGVMPDCGGGFGSISVASSHEFAEAVTDAIPTPGSHPAYPQAWNTHDGYEIGDLCEGFDATLSAGAARYTVQEVFDAKAGACGTGNFRSP